MGFMDKVKEGAASAASAAKDAAAKVAAAYKAGCRRMDMAMGGLGGCPFALDTLVGNLATETAIAELRRQGAVLPELQPLAGLTKATHAIEAKFGASTQ